MKVCQRGVFEEHQLGMRQSTDWSLAEKYKFVDEVVVLARLTYPYMCTVWPTFIVDCLQAARADLPISIVHSNQSQRVEAPGTQSRG